MSCHEPLTPTLMTRRYGSQQVRTNKRGCAMSNRGVLWATDRRSLADISGLVRSAAVAKYRGSSFSAAAVPLFSCARYGMGACDNLKNGYRLAPLQRYILGI